MSPREESRSMASAVESGISRCISPRSLLLDIKKVRMQSSHPISLTAQVSHEMIMEKIYRPPLTSQQGAVAFWSVGLCFPSRWRRWIHRQRWKFPRHSQWRRSQHFLNAPTKRRLPLNWWRNGANRALPPHTSSSSYLISLNDKCASR